MTEIQYVNQIICYYTYGIICSSLMCKKWDSSATFINQNCGKGRLILYFATYSFCFKLKERTDFAK